MNCQGCKVSSCEQRRLWSDCVDDQADLIFCCAHAATYIRVSISRFKPNCYSYSELMYQFVDILSYTLYLDVCAHNLHVTRRLLGLHYNIQSTLVISNPKELSEILRDIRTLTYQTCRIEEKLF